MALRIDSHIHVVGDAARAPMVASRTYTPGPAPLRSLQAEAAPCGVGRFVVVQPSFYGTDNTVLLEALGELGEDGRGVAVLDPGAPGDLAALHAAGVRGVRVNFYSTLSRRAAGPLDAAFAGAARLAAGLGWHVEVLADLPVLTAQALLLATSPAPVVIDHYGLHGTLTPRDREGRALLDLLRLDHVWLKLSAPYRVGEDLATRADPAWMEAFLQAAAPRCVWGSDWPHTPPHREQTGGGLPLGYRALDYAEVVEGFRLSVGDAGLAEAIMTAHPARLYGFEEGGG